MMKKLLILIRNGFMQFSRINQLKYADARTRRKIIFTYIVVFAALVGLLIYWSRALNTIFSLQWIAEDVIIYLVTPMVLISTIINVFIGVFWGGSLLLSDSNVEVMLALPVSSITLTVSKLSILYLFQILLNIILVLPMIILFGNINDAKFLFYLIMVGIILLLPLFPGLIGTVIGTQIYKILKHSSVVSVSVKSILVILCLFSFMLFMFGVFPLNVNKVNNLNAIVLLIYTEICNFTEQLLYLNCLSIGVYIVIVLLTCLFLVYILSKIYRCWYCGSWSLNKKRVKFDMNNKKYFSPYSQSYALLIREKRRYISTPVYMTNTLCGYMMATVFVLFTILAYDKLLPYILQLELYFQLDCDMEKLLYVYILTILTTLSSTTYPSISIEGKQMEILKSLPIRDSDIVKVKVRFHMSLSMPIIIILSTVMIFSLHLRWSIAVLCYIMPLLYSGFIGILGCLLNLFLPDFGWNNVTYIIKQSLPAILSALIGMITTCGGMFMILKFYSKSLLYGSYIVCIIVLMMILLMSLCLKYYGKMLYKKL